MAQIEKRGDTYKITVYLGKDMDGKRKYERTTYKPEATTPAEIEKEVRIYADRFEELAKNGGILAGEKMTVLEFAEKIWTPWMDFQRDKRPTRLVYEDILRLHVYPDIGTMKLSKVTSLHIQGIVDKMHRKGLSISAMKNAVAAASSIFTCALKKHVISDNPCDSRRIDYPERKKDDALHYFTVEQAQRFLDALGEPLRIEHPEVIRNNGRRIPARTEIKEFSQQYQVYFYLAIFGGFRRGELVPLKWSDVDYKKRTITISRAARRIRKEVLIKTPKTEAGYRTIVLPQVCFDKLRSLQASRKIVSPDGWVFVQADGASMMDIETPGHFFAKFLATYNLAHPDAPLPVIRLHDLRHTQATLLLAYGVDIETVRKRMGHSRASVTLDIYGHAMEELDRSAADTLERIFSGG